MRKEFCDYYLGLDIGTDSIGWAVTDDQYNVLKFNGKSMWGIRLFDNAKTAAERRTFRTARRRLDRRNDRIAILQELFAEEICKVDPTFYLRMKESKFYDGDKKVDGIYTLFNDSNYNDVHYYKEYPTIYHLRKELIENDTKHDIRLIYLALHNILKHRGHFLFPGQHFSNVSNFSNVYNSLVEALSSELEMNFEVDDINQFADVLKNRSLGIQKKASEILNITSTDDEHIGTLKNVVKLLSGGTVPIKDIINDDSIDTEEISKISFSAANWDEQWIKLQNSLGDYAFLIETLKAVYDWCLLAEILDGESYISVAKCLSYDKHASDLKLLKHYIKTYCPDKYKEVFSKSIDKLNNYVAYSGRCVYGGKKHDVVYRCNNQEEFCKYIKSLFAKVECDELEFKAMIERLNNHTFLPKQVMSSNSVIPYQVHKIELDKILENAEKEYSFLKNKDDYGYTVSDKIKSLMTFRIPYYVGPLNDAHKDAKNGHNHAWVIRKEAGKVYPWNFEQKVNVSESAEQFIVRMTNKCTYLYGADVLPKNSVLYSKFMVLNELNNLRINQEKISVELKQRIFSDLFLKLKKVTRRSLINYLTIECGFNEKEDVISGIDGDFKSNMSSYIDMQSILGEAANDKALVETIIRYIVLFGDDSKMLERSINDKYPNIFGESQLKQIAAKKYSGWGRLSREFLEEITAPDKETGEYRNIIHALWDNEDNPNLMQLLSDKYGYQKAIDEYNGKFSPEDEILTYDIVDKLYISPSVKRMLWQTLLIVKELRKILGHDPKCVFIEMARGEEEKKQRKESRKEKLINLYKKCKDEERDWVSEISNIDEASFRRDRLYLYYTQMGKCMYSGESITLQDLFDTNIYDVDHIIPQSKCKDDSIDNRVLVKKQKNGEKSDVYPLNRECQKQNREFWKYLYSHGFISKKKYDKLIRQTELSAEELADFVERQLVETRQACKAAANVLKKCLDSNIVYVKASNVSKFRQDIGFVKCRAVNDYHHAHDAYLNIVVGNVYYTKFTLNPINFIKDSSFKYNLHRMFDFDVVRNGRTAWIAENGQSISTVKKNLANNNIQFTRYAYIDKGELFNQQLVAPKEKLRPIKQNDERLLNVTKYGGYNSVKIAYFVLVKYFAKKKEIRSIEPIPVYVSNMLSNNKDVVRLYLEERLNADRIEILIDKIKLSSLIEKDGWKAHISGGATQLEIRNANQLLLDPDLYKYCKEISNYIDRCKDSNIKVGELSALKFKNIYAEKNIELYKAIERKMQSRIFATLYSGTVANAILNGYNSFVELSIERQLVVLYDILNILHCSPTRGNLKSIGGSNDVGRLFVSKRISDNNKLKLINQSVTGLFEQIVDLSLL